jgi:predicted nucleic acid-binding protein
MTVRYFDSSAVVSGVLEEKDHPAVGELWNSADERLSSSLLRIECIIALRRAAIQHGIAADDTWVRERLDVMAQFLDGMNFKAIDGSIEEVIKLTPALADCGTLDAIHIATALHVRTFIDGPFEIVTLDKRMKQLAKKVGFQVQPSE